MAYPPDVRDAVVMSRISLKYVSKWLLYALTAVILVFALAYYWLLHTAPGAAWMWGRLERVTDVSIRSEKVLGDLASGFSIEGLEYRSSDLDLLVRRVELVAGPGWWPLSVEVRKLGLQDVTLRVRESDTTAVAVSRKSALRTTLESLRLPVTLEIHAAAMDNFDLQNGDEPPLRLLNTLALRATLNESLVIDELEVVTPDGSATIQGHLSLEYPYGLSVDVDGRYSKPAKNGLDGLDLPFVLGSVGNLDKLHVSLASSELALDMEGDINDPFDHPQWDIEAVMGDLGWLLGEGDQDVNITDLKLVSRGQPDDWSLRLDSNVVIDALQNSRLSIDGRGTTTGLEISRAALNGPDADLESSGYVDWSEDAKAGFDIAIRQFDPSVWFADWPGGEKISGDLELSWSKAGLKIPASRLGVTGTDLVIDLSADIDVDNNRVAASLAWVDFNWPLVGGSPDFVSPSGQLKVSGNLDQWTGGGQISVRMGDYPQGVFELRADGSQTAGRLTILGGEVLGGSIQGDASANWADKLVWNASIKGQGIDPEPLLPGWPGRLNTELEIAASDLTGQLQVKLVSLQGLLRGVPVSGQGVLWLNDGRMMFDHLDIQLDGAELRLHGDFEDPAGVAISFNGDLPSMLLAGASGKLELEGRFSASARQPLINVRMQALNLAWDGYSAKALAITTAETEAVGEIPPMQLQASAVTIRDTLIEEVSVSVSPEGEQYRLGADLLSEDFTLDASVKLMAENPHNLFNSPWRGVLEKLSVTFNPSHRFELTAAAPLQWGPESAQVGPFCLEENGGAGLCLGGNYEQESEWTLLADLSAVPVDYFRDLLGFDVHFEQFFEGRLEWRQRTGQAPTGGAEIRISAGRVLDLEDGELLTETSEGKFAFALKNGNLESGVLDINFPGDSFIDVDFRVLDIMEEGGQALQGSALAHLGDIKLMGQLALPGIDDIGGSFDSNIKLGGTLTDPAFSGGFSLSNGLIHYAPIGLRLEDIEFEGQLEKRDRGQLKGKFKAGEGLGFIDGRFMFESIEAMKLDLTFKGENLLLVNTDALKILTEADLRLGLAPERTDISGHIRIPSARLTPANVVLESVNDSEDLLIENRESGRSAIEADKKENLFFGELDVSFGDDVFIKVPGVETHIGGSVAYTWDGSLVPTAEGSYVLNGKVDIYGPILEIRNGRINFPKVAANNPLLNIRAQREILGNTQIRSAGVQVIGTLKRPVLEAYTVPVTNEDRAWALLVTGSDFDQGQGIGGFDVGTYIAPRLYVSYGISLFEDENVLSARYDLNKGFGVKITSGQRETGVDVSYTIDR